jgi:two-component system, NtrC family, response regulator
VELLRTYDVQPDRDLGTTILIADDEEAIRDELVRACRKIANIASDQILTAATLSEAFKFLTAQPIHLILLDKNFEHRDAPAENGIEAIPEMLRFRPNAQILVISASKDDQDIVEAMRLGAFGYVTKGGGDDLLIAQINKALSMARLTIEKARFEKSREQDAPIEIVAKSKSTKHLLSMIPILSETDRPVLLVGEPGTGKTEIAKLIHDCRKKYLKQDDRPFFDVNIASLSPTVIERELFGNEPKAFTGADVRPHQGFFELSNNGTLFLDEIAEISLEIQAKLLTILQEGTFYRVGGTKKLMTSFKLICATNKDLKELVAKNQFREDLYWRVSGFQLRAPSLSERREDIPDLIRSILPKMCKQNRALIAFEEIPRDFIDYLTENPPEGNIRGIENKISYLLTLSPKDRRGHRILKHWRKIPELISTRPVCRSDRDQVYLRDLLDLPYDVVGPEFPGLDALIEQIEKKVLLDAIAKFRKNKDIARALKLSEGAISLRLKRLRRDRDGTGREVALCK